MKIIAKEVRTYYTIVLDINDLESVINHYRDHSLERDFYPKAFSFMEDIKDLTESILNDVVKNLSRYGNGDTFTVIARYFGFDKWHNAGYYKEDKGRVMIVYNDGNDF